MRSLIPTPAAPRLFRLTEPASPVHPSGHPAQLLAVMDPQQQLLQQGIQGQGGGQQIQGQGGGQQIQGQGGGVRSRVTVDPGSGWRPQTEDWAGYSLGLAQGLRSFQAGVKFVSLLRDGWHDFSSPTLHHQALHVSLFCLNGFILLLAPFSGSRMEVRSQTQRAGRQRQQGLQNDAKKASDVNCNRFGHFGAGVAWISEANAAPDADPWICPAAALCVRIAWRCVTWPVPGNCCRRLWSGTSHGGLTPRTSDPSAAATPRTRGGSARGGAGAQAGAGWAERDQGRWRGQGWWQGQRWGQGC